MLYVAAGTSQQTTGSSTTIVALDAADGTVVRTYTVNGAVALVGSVSGPIARQSAMALTATGSEPPGILYFQEPVGGTLTIDGVGALDLSSGQVLWSYSVPGSAPGGMVAVGGDELYIEVGDGATMALDARHGTLIWHASLVAQLGLDTISLFADSARVYAVTTDLGVVALRAGDGTEVWRYASATNYASAQLMIDNAILGDGRLYIAALLPGPTTNSQDHPINPETVYALDAASGNLLWKLQTASSLRGWFALGTDTVYVRADDGLYAIRAADGVRLWRHAELATQGYSWVWPEAINAPLVAAGSVVIDTHYDPVPTLICFGRCPVQEYAYALDAGTGAPYWRVPVLAQETIVPRWTL